MHYSTALNQNKDKRVEAKLPMSTKCTKLLARVFTVAYIKHPLCVAICSW